MANGISRTSSESSLSSLNGQLEVPLEAPLSNSAPELAGIRVIETFPEGTRSKSEGATPSTPTPATPSKVGRFLGWLGISSKQGPPPISPVLPPGRDLRTVAGVRDFLLNGAQVDDADERRHYRETNAFKESITGCDISFIHGLLTPDSQNILKQLLIKFTENPMHFNFGLGNLIRCITLGFPGIPGGHPMVNDIKKALRDAMAVCPKDDEARRGMLRNAVMQLSLGKPEALDRFLQHVWVSPTAYEGTVRDTLFTRVNVALHTDLVDGLSALQWARCDAVWLEHDTATLVVLAMARQLFDAYPGLRESVRPDNIVARDGRWPDIANACIAALESDSIFASRANQRLVELLAPIERDFVVPRQPTHGQIQGPVNALVRYLCEHDQDLCRNIEAVQASKKPGAVQTV